MTVVEYEIAEVIAVAIKIPAAAEKRRDDLIAAGKCLGCEQPLVAGVPVRRGQCPACYSATLRNINRRKITRNELIREGSLLEATKGGRPAKNSYTQRLSRRK